MDRFMGGIMEMGICWGGMVAGGFMIDTLCLSGCVCGLLSS